MFNDTFRMIDAISSQIDPDIRHEAQRAYAADFMNVDPFILNVYGQHLEDREMLEEVEFSALRLLPPDAQREICWGIDPDGMTERAGSVRCFSQKLITASMLTGPLSSTFRDRKTTGREKKAGRRYASAGALYTIDTFALALRSAGDRLAANGIYHVVASEHCLEFLGKADGGLDSVFSDDLRGNNAAIVLLHCLN
ncbi:MAG: hypothetical protein V6Z86_01555 [Hyphomicrobiales bacterium]